jgi:flagellar hook-length control protein FliK
METQPTQHGLMQLFSSLGLATNNPLNALNPAAAEGEASETLGFKGILADYLPAQADTSPELMPAKLSSGVLPELTESQRAESRLTGSSLLSAESLPLLGQSLPLRSIPTEDTALAILASGQGGVPQSAVGSTSLSKTSLSDSSLSEGDEVDTLLAEQGFYAQSLVSSLLPIKESLAFDGNNVRTINPQNMASAAVNLDMRQGMRSGLNNKAAEQMGIDLSSVAEGDDGLELSTDRFLGAQGRDKPLTKTGMDASTTSMSQVLSNPQTSTPSEASLLAVALNEDPTTQSLEDLANIEDVEKSEVEAKLTSTERKQDDQVLRLNKGQQAWGDALSERIAMNAAKDVRQVTIHLDPPELGSLELKLQIKDDQQTQVQVQVQSPQVKEALESSAHRLRDMLASQGMELSEFDVQTGSEQDRQQAQERGDELGSSSQRDSDALGVDEEELSLDIALPKNNNLLDTFV